MVSAEPFPPRSARPSTTLRALRFVNFSKHSIQRLELKMIRDIPDNLAHLFLNLRLVDSSFLGSFDSEAEHGEDCE